MHQNTCSCFCRDIYFRELIFPFYAWNFFTFLWNSYEIKLKIQITKKKTKKNNIGETIFDIFDSTSEMWFEKSFYNLLISFSSHWVFFSISSSSFE